MLVASNIAGRLRVRDEKLRKEPLAANIREKLLETPGVTGVEANPRVGSLLVLYSAAVEGVESILELISGLLDKGVAAVAAGMAGNCPRALPVIRPGSRERC